MRTVCSMGNQNVQNNDILMKFTDALCAAFRRHRLRLRRRLMHNARVQLETTEKFLTTLTHFKKCVDATSKSVPHLLLVRYWAFPRGFSSCQSESIRQFIDALLALAFNLPSSISARGATFIINFDRQSTCLCRDLIDWPDQRLSHNRH